MSCFRLQLFFIVISGAQLLGAELTTSNGYEFKHHYPNPDYIGNKPQQCACGVANVKSRGARIVGGEMTQPNAYPWMVLITGNNTVACGGTVISDHYVLSAAHCTTLRYRQEELKVIVGEYNRCESDNNITTFSITKMIVYPRFNATNFAYDIMLLKLSMKITFSNLVRPICLPQPGQSLKQQNGTIVGWGVLTFHSPLRACVLQQVTLPVIPRDQCLNQTEYTPSMLPPTLFCAGDAEGNKDACQGDSGGPLQVVNEKGRYEILGIVSNGISCANSNYPGTYTDVAMFTAWVIVNTLDSHYCTTN